MNKKKHLIKDYKKRLEYKNKEILRLKYLMIKNNNILPLNIRMLANDDLVGLPKSKDQTQPSRARGGRNTPFSTALGTTSNTACSAGSLPCGFTREASQGLGERSKIRNRCILTGRSRGIIKE